jgi:hypothetical protein
MLTTQTIEQRIAHLETELARVVSLLPASNTDTHPKSEDPLSNNLPFGIFANDPYFDEILQDMRQERELDEDNPAYT